MGALSAALLEQGEEAYWQAATEVASDLSPAVLVPQMAKDVSLEIMLKTTDKKLFERYGPSMAESVGIAYRLATAETWEDMDAAHARTLMDAALEVLREEHLATRGLVADWDTSDPYNRIYNTTLCLMAEYPPFLDLATYLRSRKAAERLAAIDDEFRLMTALATDVKRRDLEAFSRGSLKAWLVGRFLGILAIVGEPTPLSTPDAST